eukprot:525967_1
MSTRGVHSRITLNNGAFGGKSLLISSKRGDLMDRMNQARAIINFDDTMSEEQKSNKYKLLGKLQQKINAFDSDPKPHRSRSHRHCGWSLFSL